MPPEVVEPGSPSDWLRHARSDLALAKAPQPVGVLLEMLCFHAQQAAEKSIKAVLIGQGIVPPRTHDISALLERVQPPLSIPAEMQEATHLTDYAVLTRYPGGADSVTEEQYRQAVASAERVLAWATAAVSDSARTEG
jgi:HEPN domain-containing protein